MFKKYWLLKEKVTGKAIFCQQKTYFQPPRSVTASLLALWTLLFGEYEKIGN